MQHADLAGVYIRDSGIDVVVGHDTLPNTPKYSIGSLTLARRTAEDVCGFGSTSEPMDHTLKKVCDWLKQRAPTLQSLTVASYGPFVTLRDEDRESFNKGNTSNGYGRLQKTARGELQGKPLANYFRALLEERGLTPYITVETDVSAAAVGEVYYRNRDGKVSRPELDNQTLVFVKASLGIGAAFIRRSTRWNGRLHTEGGQFYVPRWRPELQASLKGHDGKFLVREARKEANFLRKLERSEFPSQLSVNPGSVESLASALAIQHRFPDLSIDLNDPQNFARLPADHIAWHRQAWYLSHMLWTFTCIISPHHCILGGRIMAVEGMIDKVRENFAVVAGNPSHPYYPEMADPAEYILENSQHRNGVIGRPGMIGALCIAAMAASRIKR